MKLNKDIFSTQYQKYLRIKKIFEAGDIYAIISDIVARFSDDPWWQGLGPSDLTPITNIGGKSKS